MQCIDVPMQRTSIVAGVKPATVVVYTYYEPGKNMVTDHLRITE